MQCMDMLIYTAHTHGPLSPREDERIVHALCKNVGSLAEGDRGLRVCSTSEETIVANGTKLRSAVLLKAEQELVFTWIGGKHVAVVPFVVPPVSMAERIDANVHYIVPLSEKFVL